jgi:hypothetical protein
MMTRRLKQAKTAKVSPTTRAEGRKLKLGKETLKDLAPGGRSAGRVKGGFRSMGCQL